MYAQHFLRSRLWLLGLIVSTLMIWTQVARAQVAPPFTALYSFSGGSYPQKSASSLMQGADGALYGTTATGGANENGMVFRITTAGALTTLYNFSGSDGSDPIAGLIQAKDGNLYGTTTMGGASRYYGTVFQITTSGSLTTLYSFDDGNDGGYPEAGLIQGKDGDLYGTNVEVDPDVCGTVFKITTSGVLTTLHNFFDSTNVYADGNWPNGLIQGKDGNLYGTTESGGAHNTGTVFKITTSGTLTRLYSFSKVNSKGDNTDGAYPEASLIQDKDGTLYGTTNRGGAHSTGAVFKITTSGDLTTLYSFSAVDSKGNNADGANPEASLMLGKDGDLYGTTESGGINGTGTVFKLTTAGVLTTLYAFRAAPSSSGYINTDGADPTSGLLQCKDGNLYGTTNLGGVNGVGTVFKLTMIPVITSFSPTTGSIGTSITLKGANFTEATAVNFGTIPASFTIVSDTSLILTVPSPGAASAKITVINPFGKATSSRSFVMTPVITSFSPAKGPVSTTVTLKGANFTGTTAVMVGTVSASFTINSDASLTLTVPTGAVTAKISVVNAFGTGVSAKAFTVTP